jgi:adenylate cyclase class 2
MGLSETGSRAMFEVELKFAVIDGQVLRARLAELGASFGAIVEQVDTYYAHPARDFARTDEALRIRRAGPDNWITYKGPKLDQVTKTRRELELPLPPGDAGAACFGELLEAVGFRPVAQVRKRRQAVAIA